jgi:hypothetical protein
MGGAIRGRRRFRLDHTNEAVALLVQGFNVAGTLRVVVQRMSKLLDRTIQAVLEIDKNVRSPEPLTYFLARHDLAGTIKQQAEHLKRLAREPDPLIVLAYFSRTSIHLVGTKANQIGRVRESPGFFLSFHEIDMQCPPLAVRECIALFGGNLSRHCLQGSTVRPVTEHAVSRCIQPKASGFSDLPCHLSST